MKKTRLACCTSRVFVSPPCSRGVRVSLPTADILAGKEPASKIREAQGSQNTAAYPKLPHNHRGGRKEETRSPLGDQGLRSHRSCVLQGKPNA